MIQLCAEGRRLFLCKLHTALHRTAPQREDLLVCLVLSRQPDLLLPQLAVVLCPEALHAVPEMTSPFHPILPSLAAQLSAVTPQSLLVQVLLLSPLNFKVDFGCIQCLGVCDHVLPDNLLHICDMLSLDVSYNAVMSQLLLPELVFCINVHLLDSIIILL